MLLLGAGALVGSFGVIDLLTNVRTVFKLELKGLPIFMTRHGAANVHPIDHVGSSVGSIVLIQLFCANGVRGCATTVSQHQDSCQQKT